MPEQPQPSRPTRLFAGHVRSRQPDSTDPLEHPSRRRLVEAVHADPGITFRSLARRTGLASGTARHHLGVLRRHGLLMEHRIRYTIRFYPPGFDAAQFHATAALRDPSLRLLHEWLQQHPGVDQVTVLKAMAQRGWGRSTTQHRLHRLITHRAARRTWSGRRSIYEATGPAEQSAAVPPEGLAEPVAA